MGSLGKSMIFFNSSVSYTFSVNNHFSENVNGLQCLVTFYDEKNNPIHSDHFHPFRIGKISAGQKVQVTEKNVSPIIKKLTKHVDIKIWEFKVMN